MNRDCQANLVDYRPDEPGWKLNPCGRRAVAIITRKSTGAIFLCERCEGWALREARAAGDILRWEVIQDG